MLHHPFTDLTDLLSFDGQTFTDYIHAFRACQQSHTHPEDFYTDLDSESCDSDDSDDDLDQDPSNTPIADFEAFARRNPRHELPCVDFTDDLGSRDLDREYDWTSHVGRYTTMPEAWDQFKLLNYTEQAVTVDSDPSPLNTEQRKLYDVVTAQYVQELASDDPLPLLLNVDGVAGSGKTFTVLKTCAQIQELAVEAGRGNPVFRAAPTGVAAFNIMGKTLHSLLRLPVKKKKSDLSNSTLQSLQVLFQDTRFLIIDEKSMVDLKTLALIDDRLRAIFPRFSDRYFGGLNVIICGDFLQLPPVGGRPLFTAKPQGPEALKGQVLYRAFDRTLRLTQVMRQQGEDDISRRFRVALSELRESKLSQESWELLCTRVQNRLLPDEVAAFESALRLYFTNDEARERNYNDLARQNRPVKRILAQHKGRNASKASDDEADNLAAELNVCIGARVMLTSNLWTERGLVNGCMGTVFDLSWDAGLDPLSTDPLRALPTVLLIRFDDYSGPDFPGLLPGVIPVFPATRSYDYKGVSCSRTQFPLRLAYAITVHKSQGLTLSKVVLNLDQKEHCLGLSL
jgi:ATP-dependent exoDNAse (exonuclease V) alpha subunit